VAWYAVAGSEVPVFVHQHDEARVRERSGEALEAMLLHGREAVTHGNRLHPALAFGDEEPTAQCHAVLARKLDLMFRVHMDSLK
jgi:hypothetical protein